MHLRPFFGRKVPQETVITERWETKETVKLVWCPRPLYSTSYADQSNQCSPEG